MRYLVCVAAAAVSVAFGGLDVLVAHADPGSTSGPEANITDPEYDSVTFMDVSVMTPDLATLMGYDVVLTWSNYMYQDPGLLGDNLADYVDAGGAVVVMVFATDPGWGIQGRMRSDPSYLPLNCTGLNYLYTEMGDIYTAHEIMNGVSSIGSIFFWNNASVQPGATWLGDLVNGEAFAAINAAENVVGLNLYPGDYKYWTGDGWILMNNAIKYAAGSVPIQRGTWGSIKSSF